MGLGQYNSIGEYCDPHTASSVFLILILSISRPLRSFRHPVYYLPLCLCPPLTPTPHTTHTVSCSSPGGPRFISLSEQFKCNLPVEGAGGLPSGAGPTAVVVLPWVDCKELKLKGWTTDLSPVGALGKEDIPENSMQPYLVHRMIMHGRIQAFGRGGVRVIVNY